MGIYIKHTNMADEERSCSAALTHPIKAPVHKSLQLICCSSCTGK